MTPESLSTNPRYALLDEQMLLARGEDLSIDIRGGPETLTVSSRLDHPGGCVHQCAVPPPGEPGRVRADLERGAGLAAVQVAHRCQLALLPRTSALERDADRAVQQATDTRPVELKAQGVRPRVWFGERWITSVFDLFEENVAYFPALLPIIDDEDPVAVLDAGGTPALHELRLHNGTVWRWNRPVYDIARRAPAPAGGEPGAAGGTHRRRHAGQRRALLRRAADARRAGPAGVVSDGLLDGRGELHQRRA